MRYRHTAAWKKAAEGKAARDATEAYGERDVFADVPPASAEALVELAKKLNPTVGFWDPLDIVNENTAPETIGWFRHAEIKHGRVAMAGFVGYCLHANGIVFPWNIQAPLDFVGLGDLPEVSFCFDARLNALQPGSGLRHLHLQVRPDF